MMHITEHTRRYIYNNMSQNLVLLIISFTMFLAFPTHQHMTLHTKKEGRVPSTTDMCKPKNNCNIYTEVPICLRIVSDTIACLRITRNFMMPSIKTEHACTYQCLIGTRWA